MVALGGFAVHCPFGKEVEAATEARGILGYLLLHVFHVPEPEEGLTPVATRHKGLVLLRCRDSGPSPVALYSALVGALRAPPDPSSTASVIRHCHRIAPYGSLIPQRFAEVEQATSSLATHSSASGPYAVTCLRRGDDKRLPADEPPVSREEVINWVLTGLTAASPGLHISLTAPNSVVLASQFRTTTSEWQIGLAMVARDLLESRGGSLTVCTLLGKRLPSLCGRVPCTKSAGMNLRGPPRCEEATAFDSMPKCDILFRTLSPAARAAMQLDDYMERASTNVEVAERVGRMCAAVMTGVSSHRAVPCGLTVTDATAGVGCTAIGLLQWFARVQCVELDPLRVPKLNHNVQVAKADLASRGVEHLGELSVQCADYLEVLETLTQDVVFLDPPWPRIDLHHNYRHVAPTLPAATLLLGDVPLLDVACDRLLRPRRCRLVVLRLPVTTDVPDCKAWVARFPEITLRSPVRWGHAKMIFLVLHRTDDCLRPVAPQTPASMNDEFGDLGETPQ